MNMLANGKANASDLFRGGVVRRLIVCVTLMTITLTIKPALAAPEDEVRRPSIASLPLRTRTTSRR